VQRFRERRHCEEWSARCHPQLPAPD
jgi:hypothetical protein